MPTPIGFATKSGREGGRQIRRVQSAIASSRNIRCGFTAEAIASRLDRPPPGLLSVAVYWGRIAAKAEKPRYCVDNRGEIRGLLEIDRCACYFCLIPDSRILATR